jgi:hypothetical protein
MFKLPGKIPTLYADAQDWADYAEYYAIKNSKISFRTLIRDPSLIDDEIEVNGTEDESDRFLRKVDEIASEIRRRGIASNSRYPFELTDKDYSLQYIDGDELQNWVYKFLLLATRLNMTRDRVHGGLDGSLLFEQLSAEVALVYFGEKSMVDILGTSKSQVGGFRVKIADIFKKIGEGGVIHENRDYHPQDDKVDVIIWKGFTDRQPSQMIGFAQCKTGTSWANSISQLNPVTFCKNWFTQYPVVDPIQIFFCAQYFPSQIWRVRANAAGLVFDRFRILDYLPDVLSEPLLENIKIWCRAASEAHGI